MVAVVLLQEVAEVAAAPELLELQQYLIKLVLVEMA
jgi:hypothetical protein